MPITEVTALLKENKQSRDKLISNLRPSEKDDDVDAFYKGIAIIVKRLPRHLISLTISRCLSFAYDLETEAAQSTNIIMVNQQPLACGSQDQGHNFSVEKSGARNLNFTIEQENKTFFNL